MSKNDNYIIDGYGKKYDIDHNPNYKVELKYDKDGKPSGQKLTVNGEVKYNGIGPVGIKYNKKR